MGRARIVENIGEGLYRIQLLRDVETPMEDRDELERQLDESNRKYLDALGSLNDLHREKDALARTVKDLIDLYEQGLLGGEDDLPELTPDDPIDPETGDPWEDPAIGLRTQLFTAINAARSTAGVAELTRDEDLEKSLRDHALGELGRRAIPRIIGQGGSNPRDRAVGYGFMADPDVPVIMLTSAGNGDTAEVVAAWGADVLAEEHTHAATFFANTPFLYVFAVVLAAKLATGSVAPRGKDPVAEEADTETKQVEGVEPPEQRDVPKELMQAVRELAEAGLRVAAAERAMMTLRAERDAWLQRIAELGTIIAEADEIIYAWAIRWIETLPVDSIVLTFEVPGHYQRNESQPATTTFGVRSNPGGQRPIVDVPYEERPVNIVPNFFDIPASQVVSSRVMSDAAVFVNAALEPGHLRWRPMWRYATITAIPGVGTEKTHCDVELDAATGRGWDNLPLEAALGSPERELENVAISYPPCAGARMNVGDKVVVIWVDRTPGVARGGTPYVVGYQREPIPSCTDGRQNWQQL